MDRYAVIITGDRHGAGDKWARVIRDVLRPTQPHGNPLVVIHGDAPGIDTTAHQMVAMKWPEAVLLPEPADWERAEILLGNRNAAGPIRNEKMLVTLKAFDRAGWNCAVLGFHNFIHNSRGTKNMLDLGAEAGFPTFLFNDRGERERWTR
jgi:hypothetical protein